MKNIQLEIIRFDNKDTINTSALCSYSIGSERKYEDVSAILPQPYVFIVDAYLYDNNGNFVAKYPAETSMPLSSTQHYHVVGNSDSTVSLYECNDSSHYSQIGVTPIDPSSGGESGQLE